MLTRHTTGYKLSVSLEMRVNHILINIREENHVPCIEYKIISNISRIFLQIFLFSQRERIYLNKQSRKLLTQLKTQFHQLLPIIGKPSEMFWAILGMIYRFLYTQHGMLKNNSARKRLTQRKI